MDLHSVLDAAIQLVKKANELGIAAETALQAFHDRLFPEPHMGSSEGSESVYGSLPPAAQEAVDDAVEAASLTE